MSANAKHTISDEVTGFLVDREATGRSKNTLEFYSFQLKYLVKYMHQHEISTMEEVTTRALRELMIELKHDGHNEGGRHAVWRSMKVFFRWWFKEVKPKDFENPMAGVDPPKRPDNVIPGVTLGNVTAMIETCDRAFYGQRNRAIMLFMLDTGIRVSELCNLNFGNIDMKSGVVIVENGKGGKRRTIFMGARCIKEVMKYLRFRPGILPTEPMFAHQNGQRFDRKGIAAILYKCAGDAHLADVPTPHDFRRAFATQSLRNGANLRAVRDQLGHSTYAVVDRYAQLNTDDLREAHVNSSPVDRMK